ncbi:MAG: citrate/2-methylcitrate synthase [Oscillospiraceae bacterium]
MAVNQIIDFSEVTPEIKELSNLCLQNSTIDQALYAKYQVNRGLRDLNGNGVLTGLTEVSEIQSNCVVNGEKVPCEGKLFYRGVDIEDIVNGFIKEQRFGFEEVVYLLLFGTLPTQTQLNETRQLLARYRSLPTNFVRDIIMKAPSADMMNTLARSVLTLYGYDKNANDNSIDNVLRQCLQLIALFPMLSVYGYQAYNHYVKGNSLYIHNPQAELSTAENILYILRPDSKYTPLEAHILDLALVLHAEHGGGNNSTFTTHVVSSSGTDTYSTIAAALGSLKGPKHGGANIKVVQMFDDMKNTLTDWTDDEQISEYLTALLNKNAFDKTGLIYGMGHAVYSLSDPRANIFKGYVETLASAKGRADEYKLYSAVERLAPQIIGHERKIYKGVSANIDFYSGFVYSMLDLPLELFTPIFAVSRIVGWSAHRIEELINAGKIIRPAYKSVSERVDYSELSNRT